MAGGGRLVVEYLDAFAAGDFETVRRLVTDDFSFAGPIVQAHGREEFLAASAQLVPLMRGYRMLMQWDEGDDVCSVYEFSLQTPAATGSVVMAEWNTVRDGQLASSRLIFDTAAFLALMPQTREHSSSGPLPAQRLMSRLDRLRAQ